MNRLDNKIALLLNCRVSNLSDKLNHPENFIKVFNYLRGKKLTTLYKNHIGEYKEFVFGTISKKSARTQMAYNGFKNVTIDQHFYVRHRICLLFPNNPCVIESSKNGHARIFPLELVALVEDNEGDKETCNQMRKSESKCGDFVDVDTDDNISWTCPPCSHVTKFY